MNRLDKYTYLGYKQVIEEISRLKSEYFIYGMLVAEGKVVYDKNAVPDLAKIEQIIKTNGKKVVTIKNIDW